MEPISERCYPANFFDPFRNEPQHSTCFNCGETFDTDDMEYITSGGQDLYFCRDCFVALETLSEED